jgi:hypothetical protein
MTLREKPLFDFGSDVTLGTTLQDVIGRENPLLGNLSASLNISEVFDTLPKRTRVRADRAFVRSGVTRILQVC